MTKYSEWWSIKRSMYDEYGSQLPRDVQSAHSAALRAYNKALGKDEEVTFPLDREEDAKAYAEVCSVALGFRVEAYQTTRGLL